MPHRCVGVGPHESRGSLDLHADRGQAGSQAVMQVPTEPPPLFLDREHESLSRLLQVHREAQGLQRRGDRPGQVGQQPHVRGGERVARALRHHEPAHARACVGELHLHEVRRCQADGAQLPALGSVPVSQAGWIAAYGAFSASATEAASVVSTCSGDDGASSSRERSTSAA